MRLFQPTLFPQRILRVPRVTDLRPVPIANGSDAVYAIDGEGRRWVKKVIVGANDLLAESIGWLLSYVLEIPTPVGAVCGAGNDAVWLSGYLAQVTHWDPSRAQSLKNPDDLGAILALDAIIGNWDRHSGNLLLTPEDTADELKVYSIDVAGSWIGTPSDIASRGLDVPEVDKLAPGIPVDMIRDGAEKCAQTASKLPKTLLREFAAESCSIAGIRQTNVITDALCHRCEQAVVLVQTYLAKVEGRP